MDSKTQLIVRNSDNINNYSMPSTTTTTESFANIGGLTQTTATLTPTTLKNIEESFMEIIPPQPRTHPQEARFVPPVVNIASNYGSIQLSNEMHNTNSNNSNSNGSDVDFGSDYETDDSSSQSQWNAFIDKDNGSGNCSQLTDNESNGGYNRTTKPKTRGTSGRKPMRNEKLSPEEEKKRQQRRERNKQAAARCRKRRMDHTNSLLIETDGLEEKKQSLLHEINELKKQKEELEYILESHKTNCKLNATKAEQIDIKPVVSNGSVLSKARPNTLSLPCIYTDPMSDTGIPIQTPSTGLFLDALSQGGTGLTPILSSGLTPSIVTPSQANEYSVRLRDSPTVKKLVTL